MSDINKLGSMSLDDAINHCVDVIRENSECRECVNEHATLMMWLEELKELRAFRRRVIKAVTEVD